MDIKSALMWAIKILNKNNIKSAQLDAEVLLYNTLNKNKTFLYSHPEFELTKKQIKKYKKYILRKAQNEPVAYILNKKEFYGLNFFVNKHVLIPRPETELIVDEALKLKNISKILEIGTGSGCISVSLAKNLNNKKYLATDISKKALKVAKKNAKKNKVPDDIDFIKSDLLNNKKIQKFNSDIIIANLPYLPEKYKSEVDKNIFFEPQDALWSGKDGLNHYKKFFKQIKKYNLKPKYVFIEIDPNQTEKLKKTFGNKISFIKDLNNKERICKITY